MKRISFYIILFFTSLLSSSCKGKYLYLKKPFFDSKDLHIGDSIFINNTLQKIVLLDSSYVIDSVVFTRYDNSSNLKSVKTFKNGKNVFENIDYFENGSIKKYSFIDEDNANFFYERNYDSNGSLVGTQGNLFFKGYVTNINTENLEVKKGTTIDYKIFYPNPPDCNVKIYVRNNDSTLFDVFRKSKFLNFLQTVSKDNNNLGTYKTDILLQLKQNTKDSIVCYNSTLFFRVVP